MIDIHSHVLPGVDDGAESLGVALEMCRMARRDGCVAVIATPHQRTSAWWNSQPDLLDDRLRALEAVVGDSPRLFLGGEVRVDSGLLTALAEPDLTGIQALGNSRYLLLEFDRRGIGTLDAEGLVQELRLEGWRPVFAHPEFIPELAQNLDLMRALLAQGALFQLTAMSITGDFGKRIRTRARQMAAADLVQFIASDAHDTSRRPPGLSRARAWLEKEFGEERAHRVTYENPRAVLEDRPIT